MIEHLLAIDQGTTSSRAIVFDQQGKPVASSQREFAQHYPNEGWVEHDPEDIWHSTVVTVRAALAQVPNTQIATMGITNQRETTMIWHRDTGQPIYNAIVWQDRRTANYCNHLHSEGHARAINETTGLLLDPYFSATKIKWLLDNVHGARALADRGKLAFGTVDTFLLWRLTDGQVHATDSTNAARTMLFNIHTHRWDPELLRLFDIPMSLLPEVKNSADDYGRCKANWFGQAIPIAAVAGDQQAALIGQRCFAPGQAKSTYGTGCFMVANTGPKALTSNNQLLTTIAYSINNRVSYALEGSIFIAGGAIQWLRDGLNIIDDAAVTETLAKQVKQPNSVVMVPAFTGLGAPYWDPDARGAIFGITRDTGIKEIVCAALQAVCFQTKDLQKAMEQDGQRPTSIRVDGGLSANNWAMQYLANILGENVERPEIIETTALGVALLAGLQIGIYASLEHLSTLPQHITTFKPTLSKKTRNQQYRNWLSAVNKIRTTNN